ncbi:PREDICTED: uncharacterized protein LOC108448073 [Corvus brachyrhynchos]|uniref:uncharacterized protein LOC108448073 n=1 Tax=Corvus brachyrhynchos TaxID=85066 RepID=UPI0008166251|nr:PREDICTED: uncharacterized protein LOC108448073 [Corvus brachyrhynchos]
MGMGMGMGMARQDQPTPTFPEFWERRWLNVWKLQLHKPSQGFAQPEPGILLEHSRWERTGSAFKAPFIHVPRARGGWLWIGRFPLWKHPSPRCRCCATDQRLPENDSLFRPSGKANPTGMNPIPPGSSGKAAPIPGGISSPVDVAPGDTDWSGTASHPKGLHHSMRVLSVHTEDGRRSPDKSSPATSWDFPGAFPVLWELQKIPNPIKIHLPLKAAISGPHSHGPNQEALPELRGIPATRPKSRFSAGSGVQELLPGWKGPGRMPGHVAPQGTRRSRPACREQFPLPSQCPSFLERLFPKTIPETWSRSRGPGGVGGGKSSGPLPGGGRRGGEGVNRHMLHN